MLPVLIAKVLRKKVITSAIGLGSLSYKKGYNKKRILSTILVMLEKTIFFLSDEIIVESPSAVKFLKLGRYEQKLVAGARYIDNNFFQIKEELKERKNLIGYIGRLEEGKGVMNLVKAIPLILEKREDVEFLIGGDGPLCERIKDELKRSNLLQKVELTGWISNEKVPDHLNKLRSLVLPSYSEGLPTGILEAMACGTPVLATPVGGIPDVIKDGKTGFIMEDNSPDCIAKNVERALNSPNLDEIVKNARKLIEEKYTYEAAVERYRGVLEGA